MFTYPLTEKSIQQLTQVIIDALKGIYDPEIPVNIYDLGLIYTISIDPQGLATIEMTLTSPACPVAQTFPGTVENVINAIAGICDTRVELVWDPPWTRHSMSESAKLQLGLL